MIQTLDFIIDSSLDFFIIFYFALNLKNDGTMGFFI